MDLRRQIRQIVSVQKSFLQDCSSFFLVFVWDENRGNCGIEI
jgi:hypothetical protein